VKPEHAKREDNMTELHFVCASTRTRETLIVGDHVMKIGEDSVFEGHVVSVFTKRNGKTVRYVIENEDGVLHIANPKQLKFISPTLSV
jgi:hypothetical protein